MRKLMTATQREEFTHNSDMRKIRIELKKKAWAKGLLTPALVKIINETYK